MSTTHDSVTIILIEGKNTETTKETITDTFTISLETAVSILQIRRIAEMKYEIPINASNDEFINLANSKKINLQIELRNVPYATRERLECMFKREFDTISNEEQIMMITLAHYLDDKEIYDKLVKRISALMVNDIQIPSLKTQLPKEFDEITEKLNKFSTEQ